MLNRELLPSTVNNYLDYLEKNLEQTEDTVNNYGRDIYLFLRFLEKYKTLGDYKDIDKLDQKNLSKIKESYYTKIKLQDINTFLAWLSDKNNATTSKNRRISALKSFYEYLKDNDIIKENITNKIKLLKVKSREQDYLTEEETIKLLETVKNTSKTSRDVALFNVLLNLGLRNSEAREIKISDINFKTSQLKVIGKGDKERILKIPQPVIVAINEWLEERNDEYVIMNKIKKGNEEYIFLSNRGTIINIDTLNIMVKKYLKLAEIDKDSIHTHSLRHSFISRIYEKTKDIRVAQQLAGHQSISTTQRYIHQDKEYIDSVVEDYCL